jgi:hypothetical protein
MPDQRDARHLLEMAEHAAIAGDLSSADELLRDAARLQEGELGPLHPDLVSTLNNLAIVAEKTGRTSDAETFFRRASAIAAESLPADHPAVVESQTNLEGFCREHGLPIVRRGASSDAPAGEGGSKDPPAGAAPLPTVSLVGIAIAAIALIVIGYLVNRPSQPSEASMTATPPARASEPAQPPAVALPPVDRSRSAAAATPGDHRRAAPARRPASPGAIDLVAARLCQRFSPSGVRWRCDPPGDSVAPGPVVLYTRVRSPDEATIEHRWYRDDSLKQAVRLNVGANTAEGYRTYSRQTVNTGDYWRVEVRTALGEVLHEERFAVR